MKDLQKLAKECMDELDAIGVKYGKVTEWKVNTRTKTSWGTTTLYSNGTFSIDISIYLLDDNLNDKPVKDTIFHELIHTVDGCFDHGKKWQEICDLVNDCYGYELCRESTCIQYNQKVAEAPVKTFRVHCVNCGRSETKRGYRAPRWYVHYDLYRCHYCKGELAIG